MVVQNAGRIRNKIKRTEVYQKLKGLKKTTRRKLRALRSKEEEELGAAAAKQVPRTVETTRVPDHTVVEEGDTEVLGDEADDELARFWTNAQRPKIMVTTRPKPTQKIFPLIGDLMQLVPNMYYHPRRDYRVQQICEYARNKRFTHLVVLNERNKKPSGFMVSVLPEGPTAYFRCSSFVEGRRIKGHGRPTAHVPELILSRMDTRVGRRLGRILGSMFPHQPELEGRQVVTFRNMRDYVFVRHHRYIYQRGEGGKTRARLQELGPRMTLRPAWVLRNAMDASPPEREYEWRKVKADSRRKFHL